MGHFPNLVKEIDAQVQEMPTVPNKMNPKRLPTRHPIIKMPKVKEKERILKVARENQLALTGMAQLFGHHFTKGKAAGSTPGQGICLG